MTSLGHHPTVEVDSMFRTGYLEDFWPITIYDRCIIYFDLLGSFPLWPSVQGFCSWVWRIYKEGGLCPENVYFRLSPAQNRWKSPADMLRQSMKVDEIEDAFGFFGDPFNYSSSAPTKWRFLRCCRFWGVSFGRLGGTWSLLKKPLAVL